MGLRMRARHLDSLLRPVDGDVELELECVLRGYFFGPGA